MRKIIASILAAVLIIGAAAMEVSANTANTSRVCPQNGTGKGYHCGNGNFVDENNDGICDNYANGVCPQKVTGKGCRCGNGNFVDENNDGICDNCANGIRPQNGTGKGNHRGNGCGRGRNKA